MWLTIKSSYITRYATPLYAFRGVGVKILLVRVVACQSGKEEGSSGLVPKLFLEDPSRLLGSQTI